MSLLIGTETEVRLVIVAALLALKVFAFHLLLKTVDEVFIWRGDDGCATEEHLL